MQESRIDVGGISTQYLTAGEGQPLLLLHGLGDTAATWRRVIPMLSRTYRVYAPTLPGFGDSAKPEEPYSPAYFQEFVLRFMDALGVEQAVVAGNSLGGLVGARMALSAPDRVTALCVAAGGGLGPELHLGLRLLALPGYGKLVTVWNRTRIGAAQWSLGVAGLLFARPTRAPWYWLREMYRQARMPGYLPATVNTLRSVSTVRRQRRREMILDKLPLVSVPTLILWGMDDRVVPVRQARDAAARLQRGQLALIPVCGHLPQVERPEEFFAALTAFLAQVAPASARA